MSIKKASKQRGNHCSLKGPKNKRGTHFSQNKKRNHEVGTADSSAFFSATLLTARSFSMTLDSVSSCSFALSSRIFVSIFSKSKPEKSTAKLWCFIVHRHRSSNPLKYNMNWRSKISSNCLNFWMILSLSSSVFRRAA